MLLQKNNIYDRYNNTIYENGHAKIRLLQNFIDLREFSDQVVNSTNRYLNTNPHLFETIENYKDMNNRIKMFYDVETTGVDERIHSIHQISGVIEVNDEVVEGFDFKVAPHPKAKISEEAMEVCKVTEEQIRAYPPMKEIHHKLLVLLEKYVDRYNPKEKIWLIGFNNRKFDDVFLRAWFEQNKDNFFGSWFWSDSLDVMVLASEFLQDRRHKMKNFKLETVAIELGIKFNPEKLHDAEYDIWLTREIYKIVTRRAMEPSDDLF